MITAYRERLDWLLKGLEIGQLSQNQFVDGLRILAEQIDNGDFDR